MIRIVVLTCIFLLFLSGCSSGKDKLIQELQETIELRGDKVYEFQKEIEKLKEENRSLKEQLADLDPSANQASKQEEIKTENSENRVAIKFFEDYETLFNELQVMKDSYEFKQYGFSRPKYKQWQNRVYDLRDRYKSQNLRLGIPVLPMHMHQLAMEYMRDDYSEFRSWAESELKKLFRNKESYL